MQTHSNYCPECTEVVTELVGHTHYHLQSPKQRQDWETVVAALHYNGTKQLPTDKQLLVIEYADGFGRNIDPETQPEVFWDWSHVRDSSDNAIRRMAESVRMWQER